MSGDQVWLRRVPAAEAPHRGLLGTARRLARRAPRAAYDVEVWEDGRLRHARRTPRPARALVRLGGVPAPAATTAAREADASPGDWATVRP